MSAFRLRRLKPVDNLDYRSRYQVEPYCNLEVRTVHDPYSCEIIGWALIDKTDPFREEVRLQRDMLWQLREMMKRTDLSFKNTRDKPRVRKSNARMWEV